MGFKKERFKNADLRKKLDDIVLFFKKISASLTEVINKILLFVAYVVGIGIPSILYKLADKRFLKMNPSKSTWESPSGSEKIEKMY